MHFAVNRMIGDYEYGSNTYFADSGHSGSLGSADDLVQVVNRTLVDSTSSTPQYWASVTQYRYHDGETHSGNDDDRLNVQGTAHQLKSVLPEQIEYYAEQVSTGVPTRKYGDNGGDAALAKSDSDSVFTINKFIQTGRLGCKDR